MVVLASRSRRGATMIKSSRRSADKITLEVDTTIADAVLGDRKRSIEALIRIRKTAPRSKYQAYVSRTWREAIDAAVAIIERGPK